MPTFAILTPPENPHMAEFLSALERVLPNAYFEFAPGQFVGAKQNLTSEQIARDMGANGEVGSFVIFATAGYFGWHHKSLWEWLAARGTT